MYDVTEVASYLKSRPSWLEAVDPEEIAQRCRNKVAETQWVVRDLTPAQRIKLSRFFSREQSDADLRRLGGVFWYQGVYGFCKRAGIEAV
jgi:hypothetical protein